MNHKINYCIKTLNLISEYQSIFDEVIFQKGKKGEVLFNVLNDEINLALCCELPQSSFKFKGSDMYIDQFKLFNQCLNALDIPKLMQDENSLEIRSDSNKIGFKLAPVQKTNSGFNGIESPEPVCSFKMGEESLKAFQLIIKPYCDVDILIGNSSSKLVFDSSYGAVCFENEFQNTIISDTKFSVKLPSNSLQHLASGDYSVDICREGLIKFSRLNTLGVSLNLYVVDETGRV